MGTRYHGISLGMNWACIPVRLVYILLSLPTVCCSVAWSSALTGKVVAARHSRSHTHVVVRSQAGDKCMVLPSISEDDAKSLFPAGVEVHEVPSGKKYIRTTPQPQ